MDDFEKELKQGFLDEAAQLLADTEQCFLSLDQDPNNASILEKIFRLAHNLKGSAKAVGFDALGNFTHELESFLLKLKNGDLKINTAIVSLLLSCNDHLRHAIDSLKADLNASLDSTELLDKIAKIQQNPTSGEAESASAAPVEETPVQETAVQESEPEVDPTSDLTFQEETPTVDEIATMLAAETQEQLQVAQVHQLPVNNKISDKSTEKSTEKAAVNASTSEESIRVSLSRLEKLLNFVGEMVILQSVMRQQAQHSTSMLMRRTVDQLGKVTKEVQDISMSLRMVPLKQTFQKMQRIVRDTAQATGRKVNLVLQGEDTEVDKTVLERLGDPLVHMIRNAVDHGIESPEARLSAGKSDTGTIWLKAYHRSGNLIIEVKDDGGGMSAEKLKQKAIEKGVISPKAQLTEKECYQLIFAPGFSTKAQVTDVSGRGVGMDVVKTNIEQLQGDIQIETNLGFGSLFQVRLPLTLAIIDGMVIQSAEERYVIPLAHVHESTRLQEKDVKFTTGLGEILMLRGENIPLYRLCDLLGKKAKSNSITEGIAIVIRSQDQPFAVFVDDIIGQSQVVIKSLGAEVQSLKGFSGSSVLGDGRPALILELSELINRFKNRRASA